MPLHTIMETHELLDVWRLLNKNYKHYTWSHAKDNVLSLARSDRFYGFNHDINVFKDCFINPVGFTDHCLVYCSDFIKIIRLNSACWHFNTALLHDRVSRSALEYFWLTHREHKSDFNCIQQW